MNNHIKLVIASLVLFVAFAWADGPATLGNMIQLGQSTVANRPASSSTIKGALLFDLDAGVPIYNDGTAWQSMGGSSGAGAYWYDGGAGLITATENVIKYGAGANFSEDPSTTGQALTLQHTSGTTMFPRILWRDGTGVPVADIGSSSFNGYTAYTGLFLRVHKSGNVPIRFGNTTLPIYGSSGPFLGGYAYGDFGGTTAPYGLALYAATVDNAISLKNGGRLDFGSGTIDYAQSNGGGITSPGTWTSTLAFASGVGVTAPRVQASGGALSSYTSANAGTGGVGALSFDTTMQAMKVQQTSSSFSPIAQPHLIYDAQTYSTRVTGPELPAPPEIAERVKVSTTATLQMYWTYTAGTVTTAGGKPMYPLVVAGNALGYGMTASSTATSTIQRITQSQYRPMWCQRVRTDVVTDALIFGGLSSAAPVAGGITAQTGTFAYLYYEAGNARWQLCTRDGVAAATCANTASVAASTSYLLCLRVTTTSVDALVDGVHVGSTSTNLPPSGTGLAPVIAMEAVNTAHTLYIGPMQVESY